MATGFAVRGAGLAANWGLMIVCRLLSPAAPESPGDTPEKFEELLGRLEQIVAEMETAELPLDKLLSSYEEGMRLVKTCGDRLADAEQKVEILSRALTAEPGKAGAVAAPAGEIPPAEPVPPEEDIRLF
jgi:exodeoxyribonuclease VII small subunit